MECWGAGVGSVQGQSRGGTALDMDRETLEPQGRGPLTNVHSELGEKILGKPGVRNEKACLPPGATLQGNGLGLRIGFLTVLQQAARQPHVREPHCLAGGRTRS